MEQLNHLETQTNAQAEEPANEKKSDEQRITTKRDACSISLHPGYYINSVELFWGLNRVMPEQTQRKEQYLRFDMIRHMLDFQAYESEHIFKNKIKGEMRSLSLQHCSRKY